MPTFIDPALYRNRQRQDPRLTQLPAARTVGSSGQGITGLTAALPGLAKNKGLSGLSKMLASKGGILGKIGKAGKSSPTPWMLGGTAAGILGNLISKKHAKTGGFVGGAGKGAATGAMIGSVIPGIGTAVGGVVGGLIGGLKGLFGGKKKLKEKKAAEALAKAQSAVPSFAPASPYPSWMAAQQAGIQQWTPQAPWSYAGSANKLISQLPPGVAGTVGGAPYDVGTGIGGYGSYGA